MQTSIQKVSPFLIEITIKEDAKELEKSTQKVINTLKESGQIKGFRKGGNIPNEIIIKHYGEAMITEEAMTDLANTLYKKVLKKENILPTSPANIKEVKGTNPVEMIIEVEVLPEVHIDDAKMKKIKLKKTSVKVEQTDVDTKISDIERRFSEYEDIIDGVVTQGDRVVVNTQGYDKKGGKAIVETKVTDFPLVIGSGTFIPGFEDQLIGAKVNEEIEVRVTFPEDYHADEFKGRKVFFLTTIAKIERIKKLDWNEDFIEKIRGKRIDFDAFKKLLEKEIHEEKEAEQRQKDEETLLNEFLQITDIEVGPHLLAHEIEEAWNTFTKDVESRGIPLKHYLEHVKKDETSYKEDVIKPEALKRIKAELILAKLKDIFKMEITAEDIQKEISAILEKYENPAVVERLKEMFQPGTKHYQDIESKLQYRKIIDGFFA